MSRILSKSVSRRKFLKLAGGGAVGIAAGAMGFLTLSRNKVYSMNQRQLHMGTFVDIIAEGTDKAKLSTALENAFTEIERVDEDMSTFKNASSIYRLNADSSKTVAKVDSDLFYVLDKAVEYYKLTDGAFDVTVGPLVDLWGFHDRKFQIPDEKELRSTLQKVGSDAIKTRPSTQTVKFATPDLQLDLGGIAKGFAVDKAVEALKESTISAGLVNAGGDIKLFGSPHNQKDWRVGLRNPIDKDSILDVIHMATGAITTSGNYESFFTYRGNKFAHIINPKTGKPVENVLSVSVLTNSALKADALSTGAFSLGPEETFNLVRQLNQTEVIYIYKKENKIKIGTSKGLSGELDTDRLVTKLNQV